MLNSLFHLNKRKSVLHYPWLTHFTDKEWEKMNIRAFKREAKSIFKTKTGQDINENKFKLLQFVLGEAEGRIYAIGFENSRPVKYNDIAFRGLVEMPDKSLEEFFVRVTLIDEYSSTVLTFRPSKKFAFTPSKIIDFA